MHHGFSTGEGMVFESREDAKKRREAAGSTLWQRRTRREPFHSKTAYAWIRGLWNHEIHEIHENPGPQGQGKGCRIGRFVSGRSKVNAHGGVPSPGGNVAEPSRLWLDHVQRQDAAATFHEGPVKVEAASSRLPSMHPWQDAAALCHRDAWRSGILAAA